MDVSVNVKSGRGPDGAGRADRPDGDGGRDRHDHPGMDGAGKFRRRHHHGLQDRMVGGRDHELGGPGRQHRVERADLLGRHARRRHHAALPRLGDQLGGRRSGVERGQHHDGRAGHGHGGGDAVNPWRTTALWRSSSRRPPASMHSRRDLSSSDRLPSRTGRRPRGLTTSPRRYRLRSPSTTSARKRSPASSAGRRHSRYSSLSFPMQSSRATRRLRRRWSGPPT